uniref:Uncharacterized protein n=1 Tax=Cacopsylla melanoneura TaxID=428564 RepID=A0A8D8Q2U9_9HEMI
MAGIEDLFLNNEQLDLLNMLKETKLARDHKVVADLEEFIEKSLEESSVKNSVDTNQMNSEFKSLNSKLSLIQDKICKFNQLTSENSSDAQFVNIDCPKGLDLSSALHSVIQMQKIDVNELLENFSEENMKAMFLRDSQYP